MVANGTLQLESISLPTMRSTKPGLIFVHPKKHRERKQTEENDGCDAGRGLQKYCGATSNRIVTSFEVQICLRVQLIVGSRYQTIRWVTVPGGNW